VIKKMRAQWTLVFVIAVAQGCAAGDQMPPTNETPPTSSTSAVPDAMLVEAKADAARRTSKSEKEITVVSAEPVTWSDASMGCPEPGRMYAQVLVSGYRIVLRAGNDQLTYHAGKSGKPTLCPADRAKPPTQSRDT
jgi:hypothetical protein